MAGGTLTMDTIFETNDTVICAQLLTLKISENTPEYMHKARNIYKDYFISHVLESCRSSANYHLLSSKTLSSIKVSFNDEVIDDWADDFRYLAPDISDTQLEELQKQYQELSANLFSNFWNFGRRNEPEMESIPKPELSSTPSKPANEKPENIPASTPQKIKIEEYRKFKSMEDELIFYLRSDFNTLVKRLNSVVSSEESGFETARAVVLLQHFRPNTFSKLCFYIDLTRGFEVVDDSSFNDILFPASIQADDPISASVLAKFALLKAMDDHSNIETGSYFDGFLRISGIIRHEDGTMFKLIYNINGDTEDIKKMIRSR